MKTCIACSMPLNDPKEIGAELPEGSVCIHCVAPDGKVKSCEEVFEGGVQFFLSALPNTNRALAEKLVRKNMNQLPYWQDKKEACLQGGEATDEEFARALSQL
jgi:hypothetical protein